MSDPAPPSGRNEDRSPGRLSGWPSWSSELHASLASHEASAAELREELEDLRRTLDAAPDVAGRARRSPRRALVVAGTLTVAAGMAIGVARLERPSPPAAATPSTAATPRTTPAPFPKVDAAPLPVWPGTDRAEPPGLPPRGVGADTAGTEVTAALAADRRGLDVYERAVLTAGGAVLTLRPAASPDLTRTLAAPLPTVDDLRAEVDGTPVAVTRTGAGWSIATPPGAAPRRLALRYRLAGALIHTPPAPPGRYTLVLTPLAPSAGTGAGEAVVVRIRDSRVAELYCPGAAQQLCGRATGELHVATVPPGAEPSVVGLVTFPS